LSSSSDTSEPSSDLSGLAGGLSLSDILETAIRGAYACSRVDLWC
jgi:hypothetical protein